MKRPTRWSYSALSTYEECAAKYAYSYIQNIPWPSSPAMERGTLLHTMAEDYMKDPIMPVPYDLKRIGKLISGLRDKKAKAEEVWMVDRQWKPTDDPKQAWVKAIVDVHHYEQEVVYVHDYKSGREYPSHRGQLELYSILAMCKYPLAARAESSAIYIDGGFVANESSIIRPMVQPLIDNWTKRAMRMEEDTSFIASPGGACRWCPYRSSAGGPCGESAKAGL